MSNLFDIRRIHNLIKISVVCLLTVGFLIASAVPVKAVNTVPTEEQTQAAEQRKMLPIESNEIDGWPEGPRLGAESAILIDADTGIVLYEKNVNEKLFPASTTKLMTALLVLENTGLDDIVTFSYDSVHNVEASSSRIGIDQGEELTVEQCLYGLLLGSGNEVAYALAEHIGGSMEAFVQMMNDKAKELGCVNTHFMNANGLPDDEHYTSAYDLALIARECFKNDSLATIAGSRKYTIPPTNKQKEERPLENHHLMVPGLKYEYEGYICGKTGYTSVARQTLVTMAEKEGLRLICVIMKEEAPNQFLDTRELFEYGFENFRKLNVADNETRYTLSSATFFNTDLDIIGSSRPIVAINGDSYIIIPKTMSFDGPDVNIEYSDGSDRAIAYLTYTVDSHKVGAARLEYADTGNKPFEFANIITATTKDELPKNVESEHKVVFVNVGRVILIVVAVLLGIFLVLFVISMIIRYLHSNYRKEQKLKKRYKKRKKNPYSDL